MNRPFCAATLLLALFLCACSAERTRQVTRHVEEPDGPVRVYVGTYTGKESKGIYLTELDPKTGSLTEPRLAAETTSPAFLAVHPSKRFLYAVNEVPKFQDRETGSVSAFSIASDGTLTLLNQQPSGGGGPCHLDVGSGGSGADVVVVANYGAGSTASFSLGRDGSLQAPGTVIQHQGKSVDPRRQEGPHAHCAVIAPGTKSGFGRVLVADLGLDKILVYRFDKTGRLTPNDPPSGAATPGAGPRHLAFGRETIVYVNNEMASTVTTYDYDTHTGALESIQTLSTLPAGFDGKNNSTAEIAVHPTEKFVYVSNRGHDSIAIFRVDPETGKLTAAGHESTGGKTPRNFAIAPGGKYLLAANQGSDSVVVFAIDQRTGDLTPTGTTVKVPAPVCVTFVARY